MIRSYPEKTRKRIARLDDYIRENLLSNGSFICGSFDECRASRCGFPFYEGQMSHVGKHYDLEVDGRPTRIVVVGQEYGHKPSCVTLSSRSEMIANSSKAMFKDRNHHMKGTTLILRLLLGREPGEDKEGESLLGDLNSHVFDGFALVNYLLCTVVEKPGVMKGYSSREMQRNCSRHFLATLKILQPTVIVAQGVGVRHWMASAFQPIRRSPKAEIVDIDGTQVSLLSFMHPSAGGKAGWWGRDPESPYIQNVVAPTIKEYLSS